MDEEQAEVAKREKSERRVSLERDSVLSGSRTSLLSEGSEDEGSPRSSFEREFERQRTLSLIISSPRRLDDPELVSPAHSSGLVCAACMREIRGNSVFDEEENAATHSECFQLRRHFEEEELEDDDDEDVFPNFSDIQKIVVYWRNLYFNKLEESEYDADEKIRLEERIKELLKKNKELESVRHEKAAMISLQEANHKMKTQISELVTELNEMTLKFHEVSHLYEDEQQRNAVSTPVREHVVKELAEIKQVETCLEDKLEEFEVKYDELSKISKAAVLEKDQTILKLQTQKKLLEVQLKQLQEHQTAVYEATKAREDEFKALHQKVQKVVQMYEQQKKSENREIVELQAKYDALLASTKEQQPTVLRNTRSHSIEGISLLDLQAKYEELKVKYETQVDSLKGTSLQRSLTRKRTKKEPISNPEQVKRLMEAEAAVVKEGGLQYRLLIGVDGKRLKVKDISDSWAILNNQFLELYPNKEARFTKKKIKLDLTGASVEFDKDTKKRKDGGGGGLRLNTMLQGCYSLTFPTSDDSEDWLKHLQQVCQTNVPKSFDDVAGSARRSHCIPHRFKESFFTLTPTKCRVCNSLIHGRGFRCIHCNFSCHEKCSSSVPPNCGLGDHPKTTLPRDKKSSVLISPKTIGTSSSHVKAPSSTINDLNVFQAAGGVFGVPLTDIPGGDEEIPVVVSLCITAIERKGGLELEGIYRIPGIKGDIEKLRMHFAYGRPNLDDEEWGDINVVGGALKLWFRLLPGSLLTQSLFFEFLGCLAPKDQDMKIQRLMSVLAKLPKRNYLILKYLIHHLDRVAEYGKVNKMHAENLAAIFGPSLMSSPKGDDFAAIAQQCLVVELMIKNYQRIFEPVTPAS